MECMLKCQMLKDNLVLNSMSVKFQNNNNFLFNLYLYLETIITLSINFGTHLIRRVFAYT